MIKTSIILFVLFYLVTAHSQQTIDKLNSNQLKLPKETISKALSLDATGQVKSSATSSVELGYLSGASSNVQDQIDGKANDADAVHLTGDESIAGVKTLTGKLVASSTVNASIPCPVMTQTQRDAIVTPMVGDCVFNSDSSLSNIYDGSLWKAMGGGGVPLWQVLTDYVVGDVVIEIPQYKIYIANSTHTSSADFSLDLIGGLWLEVSAGGIVQWIAGKFYNINDLMTYNNIIYISNSAHTSSGMSPNLINWIQIGGGDGISIWSSGNFYSLDQIVIESNKIYRSTLPHTSSSSFATDLASLLWQEVSQGVTSPVSTYDGGTGQSITPVDGAILYSDFDSFELLNPGFSGQFLQSNGSAAPSWGSPTQYEVTNFLETPTYTGILLETGNKNILTNPSFEHSTFESGGWVKFAGIFTEDFANKIDGAKSAKLVLSSQVMSLTQSSVLYQSNFVDGVQGIATVRVKSNVALKVCSIQAGTVSTTNCVDVPSDNKWGLFKVPFILGSVSNGISISSNGSSVSGTVYIDDAFVGPVDLKADVPLVTSQSSYLGQTANFGNATITGALTSSVGSGVYSYNSGTGIYTVLKAAKFNISAMLRTGSAASAISVITVNSASVSLATSLPTTFARAVSSFTGILQINDTFSISGGSAATSDEQKISVSATEYVNNSVYTSNNANYSPRAFTPSVAYGAGGATNVAWTGTESRNGNKLIVDIKGTFSGLSASFTTPKFTIPNNLVVDTSSILIGANGFKVVGYGSVEDAGIANYQLFATSLNGTQVTVDLFNAAGTYTNNANIQNTVPTTFNNLDTITLHYEVPILGWENSNIIIGSFNGLQTCTDTLACTDTFSAKVNTAGTVTDENQGFINGNCAVTGTSVYTCTFNSGIFTVAPNCNVTVDDVGTGSAIVMLSSGSPTNSSVVFTTKNGSGTAVAGRTNISCSKTGADYIGKTAMAVASDQNVRSIGSTNVDIQSVYFGTGALCNTQCTTGNCTICGQVGSKITSVQFSSAGIYLVNGIDSTKYMCSGSGHTTVASVALSHARNAGSPTTQAVIEASGANVRNATFTCIGIP